MGGFEDLNIAGLRALGFGAEWMDIDDYTEIPDGAAAGVYMQGSPKAAGYVALRENVAKRTSRVSVSVVALTGTTYRVTINGNNVNYNSTSEGPADADELVAGIADGINDDVTVGPLVTASVDPDDDTGLTIKIVGVGSADYSIDTTCTGGTGAVTVTADAISCDVRIYVTPGGTIKSGSDGAENVWVSPLDGIYTGIDFHGFMERFSVGSCDRATLVVENLAKHASDGAEVVATVKRVMMGPCVATAVT